MELKEDIVPTLKFHVMLAVNPQWNWKSTRSKELRARWGYELILNGIESLT